MFWNNLIRLCNQHGTTPTALVKTLGIAAGSVTKWKSGVIPRSTTLAKIADYFGVTVDYLLGKEPEKKPTARVLSLADALTPREISVAIAYRTHPNEQAAVDKLLDVPASDDELTVYIAAHFGKADSEGYKTMTGAEWAELESTPETDQDLT